MATPTYSFADVIRPWGPAAIEGLAKGAGAVKPSRNSDSFKLRKGSDGRGTRSGLLDKSGVVTIKLEQSSLSNDYFSAMLAQDEAGLGSPLPLRFIDASGAT